jgi:hypothetical protein
MEWIAWVISHCSLEAKSERQFTVNEKILGSKPSQRIFVDL